MAVAWELVRDAVLPAWIRQFPLTRPFAWWLCEATPKYGERRIIKHDWPREPHRESGLAEMRRQRFGILHTSLHPPIQESEGAYLARNGLLTSAEKRLVKEDPDLLNAGSHYGRFEWPGDTSEPT
jgi:hypothetical protein